MLPASLETVRLSLHVVAACVWVGGQITLAGLVPGLRALDPDAPRTVARRFNNRVAWPAFAVLFLTGLWNLAESHVSEQSTAWLATLMAKLTVVAITGISAAVHAGTKSKTVLAVTGALSLLSALLAVWFGLLLAG
jgi:putative copper export protein